MRSLDLNLLAIFEAIYQLNSVSGAADRLALSQSATSHALSRLRDACHDDLFVRTPQGLAPTRVAQTMYPVINEALDALRTTLAETAGFDPARSRRAFRISIPHPMGPFYALGLSTAIAASALTITLTVDTVSRPINLEDDLRDGVVDLAIDWLPVVLDPFVNKKLFDDRLVLIARAGHPSIGEDVTADDLRNAKFVAPHRRRHIERLPEALKRFYGLGLSEAVRVSELLEIPAIVASTDLVGIMPSTMGRFMEKHLGLRIIKVPFELPTVPIYMIWHETRSKDAGHKWLREMVFKEVHRQISV